MMEENESIITWFCSVLDSKGIPVVCEEDENVVLPTETAKCLCDLAYFSNASLLALMDVVAKVQKSSLTVQERQEVVNQALNTLKPRSQKREVDKIVEQFIREVEGGTISLTARAGCVAVTNTMTEKKWKGYLDKFGNKGWSLRICTAACLNVEVLAALKITLKDCLVEPVLPLETPKSIFNCSDNAELCLEVWTPNYSSYSNKIRMRNLAKVFSQEVHDVIRWNVRVDHPPFSLLFVDTDEGLNLERLPGNRGFSSRTEDWKKLALAKQLFEDSKDRMKILPKHPLFVLLCLKNARDFGVRSVEAFLMSENVTLEETKDMTKGDVCVSPLNLARLIDEMMGWSWCVEIAKRLESYLTKNCKEKNLRKMNDSQDLCKLESECLNSLLSEQLFSKAVGSLSESKKAYRWFVADNWMCFFKSNQKRRFPTITEDGVLVLDLFIEPYRKKEKDSCNGRWSWEELLSLDKSIFSKVQSLSMSGCNFSNSDCDNLKAFVAADRFPKLAKLDLSCNILKNDQPVAELLKVLVRRGVEVNLEDNMFNCSDGRKEWSNFKNNLKKEERSLIKD